MRKAKFGIIGAGFWGRNHARVLKELEDAELVAVCDIDQARAEEVGRKFGADWYTEDEALLKREDVEAICVCTPTATHAKITTKTILQGKHVLVEKPMASTVEEAREIMRVAEGRGVQVMVGFIERFNPGVQRVRRLIEDGVLGEIVLAFARRVGLWPERIGDVGVIKDTAIHDLDIMRFIFSEEPLNVYARAGSLGHRFEDYAQILMGFSGIKTGFVEANWLTPHKIRKLTVTGSGAIATLDYITQEVTIEDAEKLVKPTYRWEEPLKLELQHFVNCVIEDEKPLVTSIDGLRALEIAEAALRSIRTKNVVEL
ncbi:MAG: Gfo/Idh/MocA family oxidoreductase [Candidatus Bathyarchaeia archaeon]